MLPSISILPLLLFMALLLSLSLLALAAAGHFPREQRTPAMQSGAATFVLYASLGAGALCLAAGVAIAWRAIPWYAAVIGGGVIVLVAPLLLQGLPDRFVDGPAALVAFAATAIGLAVLLMWTT
jgi:hypothetical protein